MKKVFQLMLAASTIAALNSCDRPVSCDDVNCLNGGICFEGDCECPDGFSGPNCEISTFDHGVFVTHEGNFQGGNASLSYFNKHTGSMSNNVFSSANSIPLGDVAQSMVILGDAAFIVVNNSGKIEVVNLHDLSSKGTITGLSSPRYISVVSSTKAYVSDLFSGTITIFNPQTLAKNGSIAVNGQVEEMLLLGDGKVVAAGTSSNQVYRIDPATDSLVDSVAVGIGPANLVTDANGKVWVMTNGGWGTEEPKLLRINPTDMTVELTLNFTLSNFPASLKTNADKTVLYWTDGAGVFKMGITENTVPSTAFISTSAYKVNADPANDMIYVSDAGDFNSNGKVYRFTALGAAIDTFQVGVIPGEFTFTD